MKKMACAFALTAGVGLGLAVTTSPAYAEKSVTLASSGLQLTLNAASTVPSDAVLALDVRFEGGALRRVELIVDGVTVKKKNIATRNSLGNIEFQIEANLLSEGTHDIVIKAQDAEGHTATTSTQIKVTGGASGLVKFQLYKNNAMVQGTVPLEIKLDPSIHSPYVSFFIDDTFLALTNYAPFTINWDSTHVTNGPHTVSVEVYDGETLAKIKSSSLLLNINNPGGLTTRQNETPDLNKGKQNGAQATKNAVKEVIDAGRYSAAPKSSLELQSPTGVITSLLHTSEDTILRRTHQPALGNSQNSVVVPPKALSPISPAGKLLPAIANVSNIPPAKIDRPKAFGNSDRNANVQPVRTVKPGLGGLLAAPHGFAELLTPAQSSGSLIHTVRPRKAGNMAARPALTIETNPTNNRAALQSIRAVSAALIAKSVIKVAPLQVAHVNRPLFGPGDLAGHAHSIQVAFDDTRIAFDVQPRLEHGMPIAPFRQIFEHTGGTIQWFNQSKTLRAVNSAREIEFKVGEDQAKVNNQIVKMESKPFIEKGRTIVPLSFVRDALNVKISYDATTGHLRIESKQ